MTQNSTVQDFICETPEETFALGEKFGVNLKGGEVILLKGELGAGKTLFVKGVMNALGYDVDEVTSPTFTLVNNYETGDLKIFHIDLYRLNEGFTAAYAVDLDDILADERAVVFIEWAERLKNFPMPANTMLIEITGDGDESRFVKISSFKSHLD